MMQGEPRDILLERVGEVDVVQLYVPGFEELERKDRMLAYYLYRAALAGRKMAIDQSNRFALPAMRTLEAICRSKDIVEPRLLAPIFEALKLIWLHNGLHNAHTRRKLNFELTKRELYSAALFAGVDVDRELADAILNPGLYPSNCTKKADDIIAESHNNFYLNLTQAEVEAWAKENERYPLNSRLAKYGSRLVEEVYRAGGGQVPEGLYGPELRMVNYWLNQALYCATDVGQARALNCLIRYFETGNPAEFKKFNEYWVGYLTPVDFTIGFIENYLDARGAKGHYEGLIHCVDAEASKVMERLGAEAAYFESGMPWADRYKNPDAKPLPYRIVNTIFSCGGAGPFSFIGVNLPNDDEVRARCGSKSVMLGNIVASYRAVTGGAIIREFAWDEEEVRLHEQWGRRVQDLHVAMHEVLGHASGKVLGGDSRKLLPGCYQTLEEARADLVSLWLIFDPKLKELGLVPESDEVGMAHYREYVRNGGLVQLRLAAGLDVWEQDHSKNRQLVTRYLMENAFGVSQKTRDGKSYIVVEDFARMRVGIGELLAEVMRIKAEADLPAARALIARYGTEIDKPLRDEVVARVSALNVANRVAFVMPELRLVYDRGRAMDAELHYPRNLADQMLRFGME